MAKRVKPKPLLLVIIAIPILLLFGVGCSWFYLQSPVDSNDKNDIEVVIESGANSTQIANVLKEKELIRSVTLFKIYIKVNDVKTLKASTYQFNKSMSLEEIIKALETGVVSNDGALKLTFNDGERISKYIEVISNNTNDDYETVVSVMTDKEYISELISKYWFLTDDILADGIFYPLEGYLAPDTYYFEQYATTKDIVKRMLDQMEVNLKKYKDVMMDDPHYYITMASIVQLEGTNLDNRKMIVGIFKNRLSSGYNLGSDVTTYYALQKSMKEDLTVDDLNVVSPYNTRGANMICKMPIGPICNPNISSIEASVYPTENDYYFFVADKYGNIYYTKTNREHEQKIAEIKANGDWIFD